MSLDRLADYLHHFARAKAPFLFTTRSVRAIRLAFATIIVLVLCRELTNLGWRDVAAALPMEIAFHLLFLTRFLVLPFFEWIIYHRLWRLRSNKVFKVFLRKRAYNFAVFDYSGEVYFGAWARGQPGLRHRAVFSTIKDVNILSAVSGAIVTLALIAMLMMMGTFENHVGFPWLAPSLGTLVLANLALTGAVGVFHRRVLVLTRKQAMEVLLLHTLRLVAVAALLACQWWSAAPNVAVEAWLLFLCLYLVIGRLPLLPNKDLMFLTVAISLTGLVEEARVEVASILVANAALMQIANLIVYVGTIRPAPGIGARVGSELSE